MEPIDYLRVARHRWRLIGVCLLIAVIAAWVTTPSHPHAGASVTSYRATATLLQPSTSQRPLAYTALFVTTGAVPKAVAKQLHYQGDPALLAAQVQVTEDDKVGSLVITASDLDGARAAKIANAFAGRTIRYFRDEALQQQQDQLATTNGQLNQLSKQVADLNSQVQANPNDLLLKARRDSTITRYSATYAQAQQIQSTAPDPELAILQDATPIPVAASGFVAPSSRLGRLELALAVGLLLGYALALLLERLDTRMRNRASVQRALGVPVLAEVPRLSRGLRKRAGVVATVDPASPAADAFRTLRSALMLIPSKTLSLSNGDQVVADVNSTPQVILVTSARSAEGKTTTTANLAACLAEAGRSVLVLDCDFRNPQMHKMLDVPFGPGLSDMMASTEPMSLRTLARPSSVKGVQLVTAGTAIDHPAALPTRMTQVIQQARQFAGIVLIDSAPMLFANDALDLMPLVDTTLIVCRSGRVTAEQGQRVRELLTRLQVPVVGTALIGGRTGSAHFTMAGTSSTTAWARRTRSGHHAADPSTLDLLDESDAVRQNGARR